MIRYDELKRAVLNIIKNPTCFVNAAEEGLDYDDKLRIILSDYISVQDKLLIQIVGAESKDKKHLIEANRTILSKLKKSKVVRFSREACDIIDSNVDLWVHEDLCKSPFDITHIEFEKPFMIDIDAAKLFATTVCVVDKNSSDDYGRDYGYMPGVYCLHHMEMKIPDDIKKTSIEVGMRLNSYLRIMPQIICTFNDDGSIYVVDDLDPITKWCSAMIRNALDLMSSPSVRMNTEEFKRTNKKRIKKKNKKATPYYTVEWSDVSIESCATGEGIKHSHRYDVRGNWATFRKGPMAGRRIWRRAHQRGPENSILIKKVRQR